MKALVGPYEMSAYFIVHLMPDPLRGYGCQKDKCTELENHVCVELDDRNSFSTKCVDVQDGEIAWSDGACRAKYDNVIESYCSLHISLLKSVGVFLLWCSRRCGSSL